MAGHLKLNIILGFVQGLTEFLPVSSSGHLAVLNYYLSGGLSITLLTELVLHLGTLIAVVIYLMPAALKDIKERFLSITLYILIGTAGTALIAFPIKGLAETALGKPKIVGVFFAVTGVYLLFSHYVKPKGIALSTLRALLIGIAQGLAVMPGLSRSGLTIITAQLLGLREEEAFTFSFYIFVPATLGASFLEMRKAQAIMTQNLSSILAGFTVSLLTSIFALYLLKRLTLKGKLWYFSPYLILIGLLLWLV